MGTPPVQANPINDTTQDERTMAMLQYVLAIFFSFLPPLIMYFVKPNSRFVRYHSMQALLLHVLVIGIIIIAVVFFVIGTLITVGTATASSSAHNAEALNGALLVVFVIFIGLFWLLMVGSLLARVIFLIVMAIKSSSGQWAEIPIVGRWSKRFAGIA